VNILAQTITPAYVPEDKSRHRFEKLRCPTTKVGNIPENTDNSYSPAIMTQDDPFISWFV
jgi:hypothetical protein